MGSTSAASLSGVAAGSGTAGDEVGTGDERSWVRLGARSPLLATEGRSAQPPRIRARSVAVTSRLNDEESVTVLGL
jgi:hypothetical protein